MTGASGGGGPRVLVIGAGAAGLAAAAKLQESQRVQVTVLEARNRIGGRIETNRDWKTGNGLPLPVDMGASWIHGTMGNPLTGLRDRFKCRTVVTDVESVAMYDKDGKRLDAEAVRYIKHVAEGVIQDMERPDPANPRTGDQALGPYLRRARTNAGELTALERAGVDFLLREHLENEWAAGAGELSALWFKDTKFEGEQEVFPGGYDKLFEGLAAPLMTDVKFGQKVSKVTYGEHGVAVVVGNRSIEAEYAILTVPLGVLKEETIEFEPRLRASKRQAIGRLAMGVLSKTWLKFRQVWWPQDTPILAYLGTGNGKWSSWYDFQPVTGEPILLALNGGDIGKQVEDAAERDLRLVRAEALDVLRQCFGTAVPRDVLVDIVNSLWSGDPFARGSYSYVPAGATPDDRDELAEPLGRLLFAGEATHRTCSQTVHGAVLSGWREARRLLSMLPELT